jgi:hypothetical protein
MAVPVYAWPPVGATGREWDYSEPISESFSALTGKRYASATKPKRRVCTLTVSGMSNNTMGVGYCVMLKQLLQGGVNLVRLNSFPYDRYISNAERQATRQALPLDWETGGVTLDWEDAGTELLWYWGTLLSGTTTTSLGFPAVTVTGLPPNTLVARPGDYVTAYEDELDATGSTAQALAPAYSNGSGSATIRLFEALAYNGVASAGGRVNLGSVDTAVFRCIGELPRAVIPRSGDWSYGWTFEEVFSDEVGGFTENTTWYQPTGTPV